MSDITTLKIGQNNEIDMLIMKDNHLSISFVENNTFEPDTEVEMVLNREQLNTLITHLYAIRHKIRTGNVTDEGEH